MFALPPDTRTTALLAALIDHIESGAISDQAALERAKIEAASRHGVFALVKNAQLVDFARAHGKEHLIGFLQTKPVRTRSGVANIAVMWKGADMGGGMFFSCPAHCTYCPQGENSPKAYTGVEPTTLRAKRLGYDPEAQVRNRVHQFHLLGHPTDKCELIVMGGTFTAMPFDFQSSFIHRCFDGFNGAPSQTLEAAQLRNESAPNRCIGLTIETRADFCTDRHIDDMLRLGCTRVEIGVQSTSDALLSAIDRGHDCQANIDAFERLRDRGLKITAHWMPGLTGLHGKIDADEEVRLFAELFTSAYQPDELKIYPTLVIPGTQLHEQWLQGSYHALDPPAMADLLVRMKAIVPPYVRIKRIMRDISEHEAAAGARTTNLRQLVAERMAATGARCRCIRCREVGLQAYDPRDATFMTRSYAAGSGTEHFLSFETTQDQIIGFLRLRLDASTTAKIRELHVYGALTPLGQKISQQHRGIGRQLLAAAEEMSQAAGKQSILVSSGVGVRPYYRRLGYALEQQVMKKML